MLLYGEGQLRYDSKSRDFYYDEDTEPPQAPAQTMQFWNSPRRLEALEDELGDGDPQGVADAIEDEIGVRVTAR
jgi:hypothetical protein